MTRFIDIEGVDGAGKQTQTNLLLNYLKLNNKKCLMISFPNYESLSSAPVKMYLNGELGNDVNCLDSYEASSLFAVDRLITMKKIDCSKYDYVLFDRYTPSNMVYQAKRFKTNEELDSFVEWIKDFEYIKLKLPAPDVVLFLDVPVEESLKLMKERKTYKSETETDIHETNVEYLKQCYNNAKHIAEKENWKIINCFENNGLKSRQEIHELIKQSLNV